MSDADLMGSSPIGRSDGARNGRTVGSVTVPTSVFPKH